MGVMVEGVWHCKEPQRDGTTDRFERPESQLRSWVTPDGAPGPTGRGGYPAEADRYHLYIAEGCPWAHRTWIYRVLEGLSDVVSMSMARHMTEDGWVFDSDTPRYRDDLHGYAAVHEVYAKGAERYSGRVTVPVFFDKQTGTIVSNESSDIIRMLDSAFDGVTGRSLDLRPAAHHAEIDALNERVYHGLNNGVYRAGFAATQNAYEEAVDEVFATLDWLEARLSGHRYLVTERPCEADWRLFPTLVRFDVGYVSAFRCNLRRLIDYPALWDYTRDLYQQPGIAQTVHPYVYKRGYHSIPLVRHPLGIVPKGPILDFTAPHRRDRLG